LAPEAAAVAWVSIVMSVPLVVFGVIAAAQECPNSHEVA
jgi:hypothetical protein